MGIYIQQLKINNKEDISSLDQKLGTFREALQNKEVKIDRIDGSSCKKPSISVEETVEGLSGLWFNYDANSLWYIIRNLCKFKKYIFKKWKLLIIIGYAYM